MTKDKKGKKRIMAWLFRKPTNNGTLPLNDQKYRKIATFCWTAISVFFLSIALMAVFCAVFPGLGISGSYIAYSKADEGNHRSVVYALEVSLDNNCTLTSYFDGQTPLAEPARRTYKWKIRYTNKKDGTESELIPWSSCQFSFENSSDLSFFQFYYFPSKGTFVAKTLNSLCEDGLCIFSKTHE